MNKKLIISLFLIFGLLSLSKSEELNFDFANSYLQSIQNKTEKIANKYNLEIKDVLPIVFPECTRFNAFVNVFETNILAYLYIQKGTAGADFSIGYFQMKPSFIEALEEEVEKNESLFTNNSKIFSYKSADSKTIREERIKRLSSEEWQIEYLCCFTKIMKNRYLKENIVAISETEFLASAYNFGFSKPSSEIISWANTPAFPYGENKSASNYIYAKLALEFKLKTY